MIETAALGEAGRLARDPFEREHITTYLYRHPERFVVAEKQAPARWCLEEGRVSIDTDADYRLVGALFADLYRGSPIETEEVIAWLLRRLP